MELEEIVRLKEVFKNRLPENVPIDSPYFSYLEICDIIDYVFNIDKGKSREQILEQLEEARSRYADCMKFGFAKSAELAKKEIEELEALLKEMD